jgi:hypothetical protein
MPWANVTQASLVTYREQSLSIVGVTLLLGDGAAIEHLVYSCIGESLIPFRLAPARVSCLKTMDIRVYHDEHDLLPRLTALSLEELRLRDHVPDALATSYNSSTVLCVVLRCGVFHFTSRL